MPINSPLPVRLEEECRKAAKTLRKFVDSSNNGLDHVIPRSVLERAHGFAIFTVAKAGFLFSARAGAGIVIARLSDGSWSPPSAIGLGGFGFGGQAGAELTDFLIVLNSSAAVTSFMSAGSLTLGGNLSVAVGPLGRNAEGSGAVSSKGKVAAMYSYSKTKGLFGGMSVEGTVIVERQDANRIAYGGTVNVKQILSGAFDPPPWTDELIGELERCTAGKTPKWVNDEDYDDGYGSPGRGGAKVRGHSRNGSGAGYAFGDAGGNRSRSGSAGAYALGADGYGNPGNSGNPGTATPPRKRAGSLFSTASRIPDDKQQDDVHSSRRPSLVKKASGLNPFGSGQSTPKRQPILASSESYNAGLTWDSEGPVRNGATGTRSRSGSVAKRPSVSGSVPGDHDLLGDWEPKDGEPIWKTADKDLLGTWEANDYGGLSASFSKLHAGNGGTHSPAARRSRSNTVSSRPAEDPISEDEYVPFETVSRHAKGPLNRRSLGTVNDKRQLSGTGTGSHSPFGQGGHERKPFDDYASSFSPSKTTSAYTSTVPKPNLSVRDGLDVGHEGYPRAVALFSFSASASGDLGLNKGDVVIVLDKVGNGDWWRGRTTSGAEGIFPSNYIEVLSVPKVLKGGLTRTELKARMPEDPFE